MPEVGEKAPDFNLLDQNRNRVILSKALKSGKVLLIFYPKDNSPVCTAQLCDYRDHFAAFKKLGVQLLAISIAHPEEHTEFAEHHHFSFPLLNDYDARVTKSYKVMSFMGVPNRAYFLIGEDGTVLYRHVEALPIFRRTAEELTKSIAEKLGVDAPALETPAAAVGGHDAHH